MKSKLFIMAALCAIGFGASAQTEKGKSFINGSIGFTSTKADTKADFASNTTLTDKVQAFSIVPRFGYFVADNLSIGLGIGYTQSKRTYNQINASSGTIFYATQTAKQDIFSIEPNLRKYVDVAEKFKFFGQLNLAIGFGKAESTNVYSAPANYSSEYSHKLTSYGAAVSPGFAFFPSKKWAIEFSFPLINYNKTKPKDVKGNTYPSTTESFTFATSSFNPNIGFNFHF